MTDAQLRKVWVDAGRPGIARFRSAARRAGFDIKLAEARQFVQKQDSRQVFAPAPKSQGRVTAARVDDRWQVDLVDFSSSSVKQNNGARAALLVTDVFSRFSWVEVLDSKSTETVAQAFHRILKRSRRRPLEAHTDGGAEFGALFDDLLKKHGIAHRTRDPMHANGLAVVDMTIRRVKEIIRQERAEGGGGWAKYMPGAVKSLNNSSNDYLMGSNPADVKSTPTLQIALQQQAGKDMEVNTELLESRKRALEEAGAFRVRLPTKTFARGTDAKWSSEVYKFSKVVGSLVYDDKGSKFPIRNVLPVARGSKRVATVASLGDGKAVEQREAMLPFAQALVAMIGPRETISLQSVGLKMRRLPGFSVRMREAKITGIGALERFVRLFPTMFKIEGEGQRKRVSRA